MANDSIFLSEEDFAGSTNQPQEESVFLTDEDFAKPPKEKEPPLSTDAYNEEVSNLLTDEFWNQPYEQKVDQLRSVYLGQDKKGQRDFEDENEVIENHKKILNAVREHDGVPVVSRKDYANLLGDSAPDVSKIANPEAAYKALDSWEATALAHARTQGGFAWKEVEDIATLQIEEFVDSQKAAIASKEAYDEEGPATLGEKFRATGAAFDRAVVNTGLELVGAHSLQRAVRTSEWFAALPPEKKIVINVPLAGELDAEALSEGLGSGFAFLSAGVVAAELLPGKIAATAMMGTGAKLGYAEAFHEVFMRTGDQEKASEAGWINAGVNAADAAFDFAIVKGLITPIKKTIDTASKIKVLAKLTPTGMLGESLATGFKVAGGAAAGMIAEGGVERTQEYLTGEIEAHYANDPTLRRTPEQLNIATIAGGLTGGAVGAAHGVRAVREGAGPAAAGEVEPIEAAPVEVAPPPAAPPEVPPPAAPPPAPAPVIAAPIGEETPPAPSETAPEGGEMESTGEELPAAETSPQEIATEDRPTNSSSGVVHTLEGRAIPSREEYLPLSDLVVQKDAPNFKAGADSEQGITESQSKILRKMKSLGLSFSQNVASNITVLEKDVTKGGEKEIISGRLRAAMLRQSLALGHKVSPNIRATVLKESDGFTLADAQKYDAGANIQDNRGDTSDYAKFFEKLTPEEMRHAEEQGLTIEPRAKAGYEIGRNASDSLQAAFYRKDPDAKVLREEDIAAVAKFAPARKQANGAKVSELQEIGLEQLQAGEDIEEALSTMEIAQRAGFGANDGQIEIEGIGSTGTIKQNSIRLAAALKQLKAENAAALTRLNAITKIGKKDLSDLTTLGIIDKNIDIQKPGALAELKKGFNETKQRLKKWASDPEMAKLVQARAERNLAKGEQMGIDLTKLPERAAESIAEPEITPYDTEDLFAPREPESDFSIPPQQVFAPALTEEEQGALNFVPAGKPDPSIPVSPVSEREAFIKEHTHSTFDSMLIPSESKSNFEARYAGGGNYVQVERPTSPPIKTNIGPQNLNAYVTRGPYKNSPGDFEIALTESKDYEGAMSPDDRKVIGKITIKDGVIDKIGVRPESQKQGLAKEMMRLARDVYGKDLQLSPKMTERDVAAAYYDTFLAPTAAGKPNLGISAASASQFEKPSEVFLKTLVSQALAETEADAPFSKEVFAELEKQNAGERIATSFPEQEFLANEFLKGKDIEALAKDYLNPEGSRPLDAIDTTTKAVILAKITKFTEQQERQARELGQNKKADDLRDLAVELEIDYLRQRTGAGQALAIGRLNNNLMNVLGTDKILAAVEALYNEGRDSLDPKVQRAILQLSKESEAISNEELNLQSLAAQLQGEQRNLSIYEAKIEQRKAELKLKQQALADARKALEKELKALQRKEKGQEKRSSEKAAELQARIKDLEQQVSDAEIKLEAAKQRAAVTQKKLKEDIKALNKAQQLLSGKRKALTRKELELRQQRAGQREKLVFKTLPIEFQGRLKELARRLEEAPTNSILRQEIAAKMLNLLTESQGISFADFMMALWYGNGLSGFSTQGINFWGSGVSLFLRSLGLVARNPSMSSTYLRGLASGSGKGLVDFGAVIQSGRVARGHTENKLFSMARNTLEQMQPDSVLEVLFSRDTIEEKNNRLKKIFKDRPGTEVLTAFGAIKFMSRLLRGADAFWYRTAKEGMIALQIAKELKANPDIADSQMAKRMADYLHNSTALAEAAFAQAEKETKAALGDEATKGDITRRVFEILESKIPADILAEGDRWGSLNTFTNHPEGMFGTMAEGVNAALSRWTISTKYGNLPLLQPVFPFVNVVANVAEAGLEFSPIGYLKTLGERGGKRKAEIAVNSMIGVSMASIIIGLAGLFDDDDDPYVALYGSGYPLTKERKDQMKQTGWRPNTLKIGSLYIPFSETPLYWLSAFGAHADNKRWNKHYDEKSGTQKLKIIMSSVGAAFGDQATLKGLTDLLGLLGLSKKEVDPTQTAAAYFSNFLPAAGLARDIDKIFNGTFQEVVPSSKGDLANISTNFVGSMFKNYPVIGESINRPMMNGFGEVISIPAEERFGMLRRTIGTFRRDDVDPEWKFLAEKGLTFSGFKRTIEVGGSGKSRVAEKRAELVGRTYVGIFTPDERYRFIEMAGPEVKKAITRVMHQAGKKSHDVLQKEIDKAVTAAKKEAKIRFIRAELKKQAELDRIPETR